MDIQEAAQLCFGFNRTSHPSTNCFTKNAYVVQRYIISFKISPRSSDSLHGMNSFAGATQSKVKALEPELFIVAPPICSPRSPKSAPSSLHCLPLLHPETCLRSSSLVRLLLFDKNNRKTQNWKSSNSTIACLESQQLSDARLLLLFLADVATVFVTTAPGDATSSRAKS